MATATLKRTVNTRLLALYGIGNIVGAGVYVLIGKIAEPAGYLSIIAFLIAALVAFCSALSYAELAARFPVSAGAAVYLHEAFKARRLSVVIGIFLVAAGAVSSATLLKGFAGYLHQFIPVEPSIAIVCAGIVLLAIMLRGIKESVGFAAFFTVIEICGLLFLVASIFISTPTALADFGSHFTTSMSALDLAAFSGIISGAFIAFYAFVGFEDMVNIAEEVKEPQKAFPTAILAAMGFVTVLYILVAVAALAVVEPSMLAASKAPLAEAFEQATGKEAGVIIVVSMVATLNGILANLIMGSRFLYGLSRRQWIHGWFGKLSKQHVPARSLTLVSIVAIIAAVWLPIEHLAQSTSLLLLIVFLSINVSLIVIRRKTAGESIRISPTFMPWAGSIATVALLISQVARLM